MSAWQQAEVLAYDQVCEHDAAQNQADMAKAMFGGGGASAPPSRGKRR